MNTQYSGITPLKRIDLRRVIFDLNFIFFLALLVEKTRVFNGKTGVYNGYPVWDSGTHILTVGIAIVATSWIWLLGRTARQWALIVCSLMFSFILFADLIYFRYFNDFITIPVLFQIGQVGALGGSIENLLNLQDFLFFADLPLMLSLAIVAPKWLKQPSRTAGLKKNIGRAGLCVFMLLFGSSLIFYAFHEANKTSAKELFEKHWWNISLYNVTGIVGFHGYDLFRYSNEHWFNKAALSDEQIAEVKNWYEERNAREQSLLSPVTGTYAGRNVIVVQMEAFQNFVLNGKVGGEEVTPNLNQLLKENVYVPNFYHQTGQGRTSDAELLTNCSLHPLPYGSVYTRYADNKYTCLPGILAGQGYETAAFHAYDPGFWNRYLAYKHVGFDTFYSKANFELDEHVGWSLGDRSFFRQSVDKLTQMKQPFYAFMVTLSSHYPYDLDDEHKTLKLGALEGSLTGNYLQALHYVDQAVGDLVTLLKEKGLWDNTIVVFYGDHDSSIVENDNLSLFLGRTISPFEAERIRNTIPFIMHLPGSGSAQTLETAAGQLDTGPTILDLLGVPVQESKFMMGTSLFKSGDRLVKFRNGSFTDGKVWFNASSDHNFEKGTCSDFATGETIGLTSCKALSELADQEMEMSDRVITYDLLNKYAE